MKSVFFPVLRCAHTVNWSLNIRVVRKKQYLFKRTNTQTPVDIMTRGRRSVDPLCSDRHSSDYNFSRNIVKLSFPWQTYAVRSGRLESGDNRDDKRTQIFRFLHARNRLTFPANASTIHVVVISTFVLRVRHSDYTRVAAVDNNLAEHRRQQSLCRFRPRKPSLSLTTRAVS